AAPEPAGDVLFPALLHDAVLRSRRRKRRLRAVGREAGRLDVGVRRRLVVVHDDQQVVVALERAGDAADAHVARAEVAGEVDDVDLLLLDLAFSLERADARRHADAGVAAWAELRVHPRRARRRRQVRSIRDVHAAGRAGDDRARARGLDEAAHGGRRFAALAGAVARGVELFQRDLVNAFDLFVIDFRSGCHKSSLHYSLRPIQVM